MRSRVQGGGLRLGVVSAGPQAVSEVGGDESEGGCGAQGEAGGDVGGPVDAEMDATGADIANPTTTARTTEQLMLLEIL
ncbi:hypothetical protein [Streptomyces sp. NPDC056817]|uniref:hypothetical protein n=1 Tax=Streptomyces sp. NPDC056817 TaxID=3345950 RepID=UPI00367D4892